MPQTGAFAGRDLDAGQKIGRYVILERVGSGAMGVVYGAYDPELDRKIALKLIKGSGAGQGPAAEARLLREAKAMARLADPNVIAVHDVGVFEQQVFLAMEFLSGGTLKRWLATAPRPWRQVLEVFVAAGRGLAAAHTAGLVHRDFKPDNVLLDKDGRPRVVDFGLAREAAEPETERPLEALSDSTSSRSGASHLDTLTRTGAMMGTPAYMAPEQFLGQPTNERTDQFSFCVALYEALYGERPFGGENLISLSFSVTEGQMRPLPRDRDVPAWIRRAVMRGLRSSPGDRFPSMAALIAALEDDPAVKRRRRLMAGGAVGVVLASVLVARHMVVKHRRELDRQIAERLEVAAHAAGTARVTAADARALRTQAWAAFDDMQRADGEALWRRALALVPAIDGGYDRGEQALDAALGFDPERAPVRAQLAGLLREHVTVAEELRLDDRARAIAARLAGYDTDGSQRKALATPGTLTLRLRPTVARAMLERYDRDPATGRRAPTPVGPVATTGTATPLAPGSYRLLIAGPGLADMAYPFELARGDRVALELSVPPAASIPDGFVYIPAGQFWFGDADERLRTQFLDTVPIHRRRTGAYLIARTETTYHDWITFLNALPEAERARHEPDVSTALRGSLRLRQSDGAWQLTFQPTSLRYVARAGEPFVYVGRREAARQDWSRFPVAGISPADADRFLSWLRSTGRVPAARLCTELEWERAARGADDRPYPHGDDLGASDANFDVTYGRVDTAYGPDVVGSHPISRSPFGVDDLAGNVLEFAVSSERPGEMVLRGGAYFFNSATCRSTNRNSVPSTFRDVTTGIRVCASVQQEQ